MSLSFNLFSFHFPRGLQRSAPREYRPDCLSRQGLRAAGMGQHHSRSEPELGKRRIHGKPHAALPFLQEASSVASHRTAVATARPPLLQKLVLSDFSTCHKVSLLKMHFLLTVCLQKNIFNMFFISFTPKTKKNEKKSLRAFACNPDWLFFRLVFVHKNSAFYLNKVIIYLLKKTNRIFLDKHALFAPQLAARAD